LARHDVLRVHVVDAREHGAIALQVAVDAVLVCQVAVDVLAVVREALDLEALSREADAAAIDGQGAVYLVAGGGEAEVEAGVVVTGHDPALPARPAGEGHREGVEAGVRVALRCLAQTDGSEAVPGFDYADVRRLVEAPELLHARLRVVGARAV